MTISAKAEGRHMLGIVGTYGVDGYVSAQPTPSVPDAHNDMAVGLDYQGLMSRARQRAKKRSGVALPGR